MTIPRRSRPSSATGRRRQTVDSAGRDIDELRKIGWPIWTRAITARGTHTLFSGRKEELSINLPMSCGGVVVEPGDFVIAGEIGVVVVPLARAEAALAEAAEQADREQRTRQGLREGRTIDELLREFGRL